MRGRVLLGLLVRLSSSVVDELDQPLIGRLLGDRNADGVAGVYPQRHGPRRPRQHLDPGLVLGAAIAAHRLLCASLDQVTTAHAANAYPGGVDAKRAVCAVEL